ncbi:PREDICTED: ras-related protein Rab-9B-like [Dinoponera quadriceps]|uniref:Ras-related protein Rab-9B-like n=1 Tax=Dinoponera quadriceps TaxID=609295 RepID=A0A6P3XW66_DINQU|nr:PREDICTED: ras-related protein Rab-9B-like [Dinoponera quadriceps]
MSTLTIGSSYRLRDVEDPPSTLLKIVVLGDTEVEKSCLVKEPTGKGENGSSIHTIGMKILTRHIKKRNKKYTLQICKIIGKKTIQEIRVPKSCIGADICVLNYRVGDPISFAKLRMWRYIFNYRINIREAGNVPFVVIGDKSDTPDFTRHASTEEVGTWCRLMDIPYFETSAKEDNIQMILETVIDKSELHDNKFEDYKKSIVLPVFV